MADKTDAFEGKTLFLLRHAMALSDGGAGDKARRLAPRGVEDAEALGRLMAKQNYVPDVVLCSSAVRTRQTFEHLKLNIPTAAIRFEDDLYTGTTGDYLHLIQGISDDYNRVLVVAHNPSIYELVILLAAQGADSVMQRLTEGYHPATLSTVQCKCKTWADIQPAENTLADFTDPMDYNAPPRPTRWM